MRLFGRPLELVILDVDGVILDLKKCFQKNLEATARKCGLPPGPIHNYLLCVGNGSKRAHAGLAGGIKELWPDASAAKRLSYAECFRAEERRNPYPPIEGSIETIHWLRKHNIPIALCTTNEWKALRHRLTAAGILPSLFDAASTFDDDYVKPNPRALDPIFRKIRAERSNTVYVGDWYPDVELAKKARIPFLAVLSGGVPCKAFLREGIPKNHIVKRLSCIKALITS